MATDGDMEAHCETYAGFTAMLKWGTVATFAVTAIVVLLIAN